MLNKLMKLKNKKGFTLVELIVVIAIIAILTAIIVPLVGRYSAQATYTTLQDAAQTISNNTNTVISDVTMMGTVFKSSPIEGKKTAGKLEVKIGSASWSDTSTASATPTLDEQVAHKLYDALNNALPADCHFFVDVATNTVSGVIYISGSGKTVADAQQAYTVADFTDAYQSAAKEPIGVSGSYKTAAKAESEIPSST